MSIENRARAYLKNISDSVIVENVMVNFAQQEVELAMCDMKNEKNNMKDQKESHRLALRQRDDLAKITVALLNKNKVLDLLQNYK